MAKKKEIELPKLPHGMGTYSWLDEDKTTIRYRKTVTINGKSSRISVCGKTLKEVNLLMHEREEQELHKIKLNISKEKTSTLEKKMSDWLYLFKLDSVNENTFDRNESTFKSHILGSDLGTMQEAAITSEDIQKFMKNLKRLNDDEPLSYSSKKKVYELLNQYFNYRYVKEPYMNPMISVSKPIKSSDENLKEELIIYDDDEIEKFCEEASKKYKNGSGGYKHGQFFIFLLWTFMRLNEARALRWKDIDFENNEVYINQTLQRVKCRDGKNAGKYEEKVFPTKNKQKRKIKMCKRAADAITEYKKQINPKSDEDYIIQSMPGKAVSEKNVYDSYKLIRRNAILDVDKNVTIHGLRHTGISYFLRHGVPVEVVSRLAGHQSIQITLDTYYQVIDEQKIQAIESLDELMKKGTD